MKIEDTIETEKKIYTSPQLVEHGTLSETTYGTGDEVPLDAFPTDPDFFSGGTN